ncbi:class I SAM-dependent methyltransferase [Streptomyces sp. NPDC006235]|uniref:class I SAM-dependent methyltransferase n=1 Tax=Streptomyces sp. NPDC006235 TaxID=3156736 RepID=UPI0033B40B75
MSRFEGMWDRFWTDLSEKPGTSPWDVDPTYVAHAHLHLFGSVLDPSQPVIDVGCGDGAQTAAIAQHFDRVIGVDVAPQALERARKHHAGPGIQYEQLDLLHPEQAAALHDRIGDAGLYVRTVLHAFTPDELKLAVTSLAHLAGETGGAFFYELAPTSRDFILGQLAGNGAPAEKFGFVFERVPLPEAREEDALQRELAAAGFDIVSTAPIDYQGTVLAGGHKVNVPAFFVVARAKGAR